MGRPVGTIENSWRTSSLLGVVQDVLGIGVDADQAGDLAVDASRFFGLADAGLGK
jgi:hypothetical protein